MIIIKNSILNNKKKIQIIINNNLQNIHKITTIKNLFGLITHNCKFLQVKHHKETYIKIFKFKKIKNKI